MDHAEEIFRQFFGGGAGFGSIFEQEFGGNSRQLVLNLTFNEAVRGCEKEVSLRVQASCERCFGSGGEPGTKEQTCPYCRGTGQVSESVVVVVGIKPYFLWEILLPIGCRARWEFNSNVFAGQQVYPAGCVCIYIYIHTYTCSRNLLRNKFLQIC